MDNQREEATSNNVNSGLKLYSPSVSHPHVFSTTRDFEMEILEHMRTNGIEYKGQIQLDGQIHRFSIDHKHNQKDEWYCAYLWTFQGVTYASCFYGSWSHQNEGWFQYESWDSSRTKFSPEELASLKRFRDEFEQKQRNATEEKQKEIAIEAQQIWEHASRHPFCPEHSVYLEKKKIQPFIARFGRHPRNSKESLMIPLLNSSQEIVSLQFIYQDDEGNIQKRFLSGGQKKGCFCLLGLPNEPSKAFIVEGFATGCSVHEASDLPVIVAFDSGNLAPVAEVVRTLYPKLRIVIASDSDEVGVSKAKEAAKKSHSEIMIPKFPNQKDALSKATDFNDLYVLGGIHETKKQLLKTRLNPIGIFDFLSMDIQPKEFVIEPFCPVKGLIMIFGYRGRRKDILCSFNCSSYCRWLFNLELSCTKSKKGPLYRWGNGKHISA